MSKPDGDKIQDTQEKQRPFATQVFACETELVGFYAPRQSFMDEYL